MRAFLIVCLLGVMAVAEGSGASSLETAQATLRAVPRETVVDAVIEAVHQSTVSAQTSGRVVEINFDVDDYVTTGSVLLRLRDREQRAAVESARARFIEARAEYERTKEVFARKLVARSELDRAEAAFKAAQAALEQAEEQLAHTVVTAPYDGIVRERHIEMGETANPGTPLMTGLSLERLRAVAQVPQVHIHKVRQQARARVRLNGDLEVTGEAITISPVADPVTHTFQVRVDLPPGRHNIYPGMFVKVAFVTGEMKRLLVPAEAVVRRSEVTAVYVVEEGRISFRQIRAGRTLEDGSVEVLAGLEAGEVVALEPIRAGVSLKQQRAGG